MIVGQCSGHPRNSERHFNSRKEEFQEVTGASNECCGIWWDILIKKVEQACGEENTNRAVYKVSSEANVCKLIPGADLRAVEGFNREAHDLITYRIYPANTELKWAKLSE